MPQSYYTATPDTESRFQCRHIFPDGHRCASPCLRTQELCYYHHTTRRPIADPHARQARRDTFTLPNPADLIHRSGIQLALAEVLQRIASNDIDPRRAGLLLYGLQIASLNLPRPAAKSETAHFANQMVDEITEDPTLGTLAPPTRLNDIEPPSHLRQILNRLDTEDRAQDEAHQSQMSEPEPQQPGTLPELQASTSLQSTPNLNPLRTLLTNRRRGRHTTTPPTSSSNRTQIAIGDNRTHAPLAAPASRHNRHRANSGHHRAR